MNKRPKINPMKIICAIATGGLVFFVEYIILIAVGDNMIAQTATMQMSIGDEPAFYHMLIRLYPIISAAISAFSGLLATYTIWKTRRSEQ